MRLLLTVTFYLLVVVLGISFAVLNANMVDINFYVKTLHMPISVLIAVTFAMGILAGLILLLWRYWCLKLAYKKIKHQLKMTEQEIQNLRIIPLKDEH